MTIYLATIQERGNGLAGAGEHVAANGALYRVISTYGPIRTGQSGTPNYLHAIVADADWSDIDDENGPYCTAQIGAEVPVDLDALRAEAAEAGDTAQVELCDRALAGDQGAIDECARAVADAQAQNA